MTADDSTMSMYMDDLRKSDGGLLAHDEERNLAQRCEAGTLASWMLDGHDPGEARISRGSSFTREDLVAETFARIRKGEGSPAEDVLGLDPDDPGDRVKLEDAASDGDGARTKMITGNLRLVVRLATSSSDAEEMVDRIQNGGIGLCHGILKYDWRTGNKISTYIYHWILQAMGRECCNTGRTIRIPAHMDARIKRVRMARSMGEDMKSLPLVLSMSEERIQEAVSCENILTVSSLDRPLSSDEGASTLADILSDGDDDSMDADIDRNELCRKVREAAGLVLNSGCGRVTALLHGFGRPRMTLEEAGRVTGLGRKALHRADEKGMQSLAAILAPLALESGEYTEEETMIGCE